jgi:hypothetical protein
MLAIALSAGVTLSTPAFAAGPAPELAVVPVRLGTNAEPALADALTAALEAGAAAGGTKVVRSDKTCADAKCFAEIAKETGASHVVAATVTAKLNDYRVELTARDTSGAVRASVNFDCEICTRPDLEAKLARETAALCGKLEATPAADPSTTPAAEAGSPPVADEAQPATSTSRRDAQPDASRSRALGIAGYASLGAGVGVLVAGSVLLGIHDRPVRSRCTGASVDANGQCEFLHDTIVVGAVLTSVGVAAIVTGIALVVVGRRSRSSPRRAAVTFGGVRF